MNVLHSPSCAHDSQKAYRRSPVRAGEFELLDK